MLLKSIIALLFVSTSTITTNLASADKLSRLWCNCAGRDMYGTVSEYHYHSDRLKKDISLFATCRFAPEFESPRQQCNAMAFRDRKHCKKDAQGTQLCYDRKYFGTDTVSLDGKKTKLKHRNWDEMVVMDCTDKCREYFPNQWHLSGACNVTIGGIAIRLSKNTCHFDRFEKLKVL